jgi:dihydrofolate reductase
MDTIPDTEFSTPFVTAQEQEYDIQEITKLSTDPTRNIFPYFSVIVAVDEKDGIGKTGKIPWNMPEDMAFFKSLTTTVTEPEKQNVVIMGRKTLESMNMRPLKSRFNICVSKTLKNEDFVHYTNMAIVGSFEDALRVAKNVNNEKIFVIGGSQLYNEAIWHGHCKEVIYNKIVGDYDCDTFLPKLNPIMFGEPIITIISENVTSTKYTTKLYTNYLENLLKDNTINNTESNN